MASGKVHLISNLLGGAGVAYVAYTALPTELAANIVVGTITAIIITPDLDLEGRTITERLLRKIPIIGLLFQWSFYLYAILFKHREWSHNFIVGTLTRVAYSIALLLFWTLMIIALYAITGRDWLVVWNTVADRLTLAFRYPYWLIGWYIQDIIHYLIDAV